MELDRYHKRLQNSDEEIYDLIRRIPQLKTLVTAEKPSILIQDNTNGILYLSRLNADEHRPAKKSDDDSDRDMEASLSASSVVSKSTNPAEISQKIRKKKRRFAYSLATLALKPEKRHVIVKEGAIDVLQELSCLNDMPTRRSCATALAALTLERSLRQTMIESGCISTIISLSSSLSRSVKADCSKALCNLSCESGYESRAVKEGTPYALVQIVTSCRENMTMCLKTILNLTSVPDKYARIEEVIDACLQMNTLEIKGEEERILFLSALCNLSAIRNNQIRLVESGCVRIVEAAIKIHSVKIRTITGEIIRNLTTCSRSRGKLIDQNIIPTLMHMSKDECENVRISCVHALYNLSRDMGCREKIVAGHAVTVIIKVSMEKMSNIDMGRTASKTLRILCNDRQLANKLVNEGIIRALMSLIKTDDVVIRQYCAESICCLFENEMILSRLIDQGAVNILVSLSLNDNVDLLTCDWCAFALYHLSTHSICPPSMLANGILPCLIKLCEIQSEQAKKFCAAALWSITNKKMIDVASAIPVLVDMLRNESDQSIKVDCASALYNLADDDSNCDRMLSAGALIPVVRLTQSDHLQTKIKCAAILSRLSQHEKYYAEFNKEFVLNVFLELSCLDHGVTQRRVVIALSKLSEFVEIRRALLKLNAPQHIMSLASKPDENIRRGCAAILCNLSYEDGSEAEMVNTGIVSTLLITALVTSDNIETKLICAKALVNLMSATSSYAKMVEEGVIWGMGKLTLLDNHDILNMCAKALCNLSCQYAKQMLSSSSTVTAIIKLLQQNSNVDIQRDSSRIITNLMLQTSDSDDDFRRLVVNSIQAMADCKDKLVNEMCVYCLSLASQSKSCRPSIVASRILDKLDIRTIINDKSVCFAYLTMIGNIADHDEARSKILEDDHLIDRFLGICSKHEMDLDLAALSALYCISCDHENIVKLAKQNGIRVMKMIWETEYEKSARTLHYVLAFLFNLTTVKQSQAQVVSQGIVAFLMKLWPQAVKSYHTCMLVMNSICHLACGQVNTAQMVLEGAVDILCFYTEHKKNNQFVSYTFEADLMERIAVSFRNLSIVYSSQEKIVGSGAIKSIVELFNISKERRNDKNLSATYAMIRQHCASAIRSLTYNISIRQQLIESGAISVILNEITTNTTPEDIVMSNELLLELEAESWCNGSRGAAKESKALYLEPLPISRDLLERTNHVVLNVEKISVEQKKYTAKVILEEPPIETQDKVENIGEALQLLSSYTDSDENIIPTPMTYHKQESDYIPRKLSNMQSKVSEYSEHKEPEHLLMDSDNENDFSAEEETLEDSNEEISVDTLQLPPKVQNKPHRESKLSHKLSRDSNSSRSSSRFPSLLSKKLTQRNLHFASDDDESSINTPISEISKPKKNLKQDPKEFKGLVALINHGAKAKNGEGVNGVLKRWTAIAKY